MKNWNSAEKRLKFHKKKLEFLNFMRDSLERRLAAIKASITTLENQIERDSPDETVLNDAES